MSRILPAIESLDQHLYHLEHHPESYRPSQCPHCGMGGLWRHGCYRRKADREGEDGVYFDPTPYFRSNALYAFIAVTLTISVAICFATESSLCMKYEYQKDAYSES